MSPSSNRSRFLVNVVGTHTASSIARPTNQRNSRLYSSCSISIRSLRTEYSTWSSSARNRCSGGIDGRPVFAYIASKPRRQPPQGLIRHRANHPQRVIGRHALLRRQVTKQVAALLVVSAHAHAPLKKGAPIVVRLNRLVDPVMNSFSASC